MGPEDKPTSGDILPMPANKEGFIPENALPAERRPSVAEASGNQPAISPVAQASDAVSASFAPAPVVNDSSTLPSQPAIAVAKDKKSRDALKKRYDDEVRRTIGQYAADPYLEVQKIEVIKQNYLRDVYNRNVRLPQTQ